MLQNFKFYEEMLVKTPISIHPIQSTQDARGTDT